MARTCQLAIQVHSYPTYNVSCKKTVILHDRPPFSSYSTLKTRRTRTTYPIPAPNTCYTAVTTQRNAQRCSQGVGECFFSQFASVSVDLPPISAVLLRRRVEQLLLSRVLRANQSAYLRTRGRYFRIVGRRSSITLYSLRILVQPRLLLT